jgi:hypothetical protein
MSEHLENNNYLHSIWNLSNPKQFEKASQLLQEPDVEISMLNVPMEEEKSIFSEFLNATHLEEILSENLLVVGENMTSDNVKNLLNVIFKAECQ